MQYSNRLRFQLIQHLDISSIKCHAALVSITLSISSLIYFFATCAKLSICATLTTPSVEIRVEIHPGKSSSGLNLLPDKLESVASTKKLKQYRSHKQERKRASDDYFF
jgi:hypothetical protein